MCNVTEVYCGYEPAPMRYMMRTDMQGRLYKYRTKRAQTVMVQSIDFLSKGETIASLKEAGKESVDSDKLPGLQMAGACKLIGHCLRSHVGTESIDKVLIGQETKMARISVKLTG